MSIYSKNNIYQNTYIYITIIHTYIYIYIYIHTYISLYTNHIHILVGGFNTSETYEFVSWDDDIPNSIGKSEKIHGSSHHQPDSNPHELVRYIYTYIYTYIYIYNYTYNHINQMM